jgi:hypothetical protein
VVSERPNTQAEGAADFERRSKALFERSVESLDGETRSRLTQARYAAIEAAQKGSVAGLRWRLWIPAGSAAAAVLAVLLVFAPGLRDSGTHGSALAFDDMDIVANDDEFDLLENVEFYSWLDTQPVESNSPDGEVG